jgi:hypothetical protein
VFCSQLRAEEVAAAVMVTAKDRLHAKILYKRPVGNMSPDRDKAGTTIN